MPALPRGRCPICKRFVALRNGALVREHRSPGKGADSRPCTGSGRKKAP